LDTWLFKAYERQTSVAQICREPLPCLLTDNQISNEVVLPNVDKLTSTINMPLGSKEKITILAFWALGVSVLRLLLQRACLRGVLESKGARQGRLVVQSDLTMAFSHEKLDFDLNFKPRNFHQFTPLWPGYCFKSQSGSGCLASKLK
jgi:hypothetical protein